LEPEFYSVILDLMREQNWLQKPTKSFLHRRLFLCANRSVVSAFSVPDHCMWLLLQLVLGQGWCPLKSGQLSQKWQEMGQRMPVV